MALQVQPDNSTVTTAIRAMEAALRNLLRSARKECILASLGEARVELVLKTG
jgi:hypothetical protein